MSVGYNMLEKIKGTICWENCRGQYLGGKSRVKYVGKDLGDTLWGVICGETLGENM